MDNGKVRIYLRAGIPVAEIFHNGELDESDIHWMHKTILQLPVNLPCDVVIDKVGSYSLSQGAIAKLGEIMHDHNRIAFIIHRWPQAHVSNFAANSYLSGHDVKQFRNIHEAIEWLAG